MCPFAQLRERFGSVALAVTLAPGATAAELRARLLADRSVLAPFRESLQVAWGAEMLAPETELGDGDVVALYSPFTGG